MHHPRTPPRRSASHDAAGQTGSPSALPAWAANSSSTPFSGDSFGVMDGLYSWLQGRRGSTGTEFSPGTFGQVGEGKNYYNPVRGRCAGPARPWPYNKKITPGHSRGHFRVGNIHKRGRNRWIAKRGGRD